MQLRKSELFPRLRKGAPVNEELRLLMELQKLDTVILAARMKMDVIPDQISTEEGPLREAQAAYEKAKQHQASFEKKKKEKEREIEDINERIRKQRQRSSDIKNNKEYQAHLTEIEKAGRQVKTIEDDLLVLMESIEESSKLLSAEGVRIKEEQAKVGAHKAELDAEVLKLREELDLLKKDRAGLVSQLDGGTYTLYMNILKHGRGVAVVEARDEICRGCHLHIPPQMFVELKSNSEITNCPQCRRILYYVKREGPSPDRGPSGEQQSEEGAIKGFMTEHSRH